MNQAKVRFLSAAAVTLLVALGAACGGGSNSDATHWPRVQELKERDITPLPVQHRIQVGDDRFSLGLQDREDQLILGADVSFRFYKIEGEKGTLKGDVPARYAGFDTSFVDERDDGTRETITGPEVGVYVASMLFDEAGKWGVEVSGSIEGEEFEPIRARFGVLEAGTMLAIGDAAPRSEQVTLRDVADISAIDSTNPPNPAMHKLTVAEALKTGKPLVVAFATPAFCTSRTCGPVMDKVVVPLFEKYAGRVNFIHIEPYDLDAARNGEGLVPVQTMAEWRLDTEPWVFVIDQEGRIAGKFEGIMGMEELEAVLQQLLQ